MTSVDLSTELEQRFGLRNTRPDWIRRQIAFSADELRGAICGTDLGVVTLGTSPWSVNDAHGVKLGTRMLVQIDDIINIANSNPRAVNCPVVMQMTLNDGCNEFVGVELEPWPNRILLSTAPGTKIVLEPSVRVMRGRVLLRECDFFVLGSPPNNIWGASYGNAVTKARLEAGLPDDESASSLGRVLHGQHAQDIALTIRNAYSNSLPTSILPQDMGGIADPSLVVDDEIARENDVSVGVLTYENLNESSRGPGRGPSALPSADEDVPEMPNSDSD